MTRSMSALIMSLITLRGLVAELSWHHMATFIHLRASRDDGEKKRIKYLRTHTGRLEARIHTCTPTHRHTFSSEKKRRAHRLHNTPFGD